MCIYHMNIFLHQYPLIKEPKVFKVLRVFKVFKVLRVFKVF